MKVLTLTTWERLELKNCIPRDAPLEKIEALLRLLKVLALSDEEQEAVGFRLETILTERGPGSLPVWDKPDLTFELEFETGDFGQLVELVNARREWPTMDGTLELKKKVDEKKEGRRKRKRKR